MVVLTIKLLFKGITVVSVDKKPREKIISNTIPRAVSGSQYCYHRPNILSCIVGARMGSRFTNGTNTTYGHKNIETGHFREICSLDPDFQCSQRFRPNIDRKSQPGATDL